MVAYYPQDATACTALFPATATVSYNNTGSTTDFNLGANAAFAGEVIAVADGVVLASSTYTLIDSGSKISFTEAPSATLLELKTTSLPDRFKVRRKIDVTSAVEYSNTTATIVNSNTFLINSNTESFALPAGSSVSSAGEIFVFLSGILQSTNAFTFPSTVYGNQGIDIGDDDATKLLLNFEDDAADSSNFENPLCTSSPTLSDTISAFGSQSLSLDGSSNVDYGSSDIFSISDSDFTIEAFANSSSLASNNTILSRYEDENNNYALKLLSNGSASWEVTDHGVRTEISGGLINTASFYHVAVSFDKSEELLGLYVNNVRVDTATIDFRPDIPSANLLLGEFNGSEYFTGNLDAIRVAHSAKYRNNALQPMISAPTKIGGGALGSQDIADTLSIRVFQGTTELFDRFSSMVDRKPDNGFDIQRNFDTIRFESQAGYEKRRLRSRRGKRTFNIVYTNLTGVAKKAIEDFYVARSGEFESFVLDLEHLNEQGTTTVRFEGPLDIRQVLSASSNLFDNFFTVSFSLKETYEWPFVIMILL